MILQTQIPIKKQERNLIDYDSKLLLLGSCFSENIGRKLAYYQFQSTQNPFGILFHPKAIETLISNAIHKKKYTEYDLFFLNERWHCFDVHSNLSSPNKQELLDHLHTIVTDTHERLQTASHIIITLGTAWVYRFLGSDSIVANCHKVPQKQFSKEILSITSVTESLTNIYNLIQSVNKKATLIFTVSPVRHIKDGFVENLRSKSNLIAGIHNFNDQLTINNKQSQYPVLDTQYFPSYEIMMDELRDYRFYAEDMIHPNQTAIDYIWEKFVATWFTDSSLTTMQRVEEIQKGLAHKAFNPNSEAHQKFLQKLSQKKTSLIKTYPFMSF